MLNLKKKINSQKNKFILLILILFISNNFLFAQTGKILGKVVESDFGDPLISANVIILGTNFGAATDINGKYEIKNIKEGNYKLKFSMIGYEAQIIENINVKKNETVKIDVILKPETFETEEVLVTAKALSNTEASLLAKRQKSVSVSDAISAEEISKSGSGDAASAMKKVTGASVVGGKYVYIRGLGERYSATMLNGTELPSADPDKKSFQLDLIPGNMLNNINTIKTFTPDKPGTFTGGLVDVTLKSYPENLAFSFSSSAGYNTLTTGNSNFILGNSGSTDFLGFDDGVREMPSVLKGGKVYIPRANAVKTREEAIYLDRISKSFNKNMLPQKATAIPNSSFAISLGNTLDIDENNSLGYFGSLSWGQNYSLIDKGNVGRYKLVGNFSSVSGLDAEFRGKDTKGIRTVDWGTIGNVAFKNSSLGEIKFSYMRTQSAEAMGRYMIGIRDRDRSFAKSTVTFETRVVSWVQRALDNYQLEGNHLISLANNLKMDWKISYSSNRQDEPDQRYFFNIFKLDKNGNRVNSFDVANSQPISRYYRDLEENNFTTQINFVLPITVWKDNKAKIKSGFYFNKTERNYNQMRFDYETNGIRLSDYNDNLSNLFNDVGIIDSTLRPNRPNRWFGLTLDNEAVKDSTNYFRANSKVFASFMMLDLPLAKQLRFVGGIRLETTDMQSHTLNKHDTKGLLDNTDFLPSLNLIYAIDKTMNLRLAYTNTIARPTFRELAPYQSFEFIGDFLYMGNPNLKRTLIKNFDLRWEWFLNPGEIIAVSGFYKNFNNPIESYIDPTFSDDNTLRSVKNVDEAKVYGVEFELRSGLQVISKALSNFKFGINLSLVKSVVDIPKEDLEEKIFNGDLNPDRTRSFVGQSPYLFNANLSYENYSTKTTAGVYYTLFGDRLFLTGRHATPDVYERGYGSLDIKVTQGIGKYFSLSISGKNLLNPNQKFTYKLDNGVVEKEFDYSSFNKGTSYSFSISYKL